MTPSEFLTTLWGDPPPGQVLIWTLPDRRSTWFRNFDAVDRFVAAYPEKDIYTGVSLASPDATLTSNMRVTNALSAGIPGLWADIDIAGPDHKKENLPGTVGEAKSAIQKLPHQPTITVHSGHGLQCWWLFVRPWIFADDRERDLARSVSHQWHNIVAEEFAHFGWTVDATHDLARVMRLPGTINNKSKPVPVTVESMTDFRWRDIPKLRATAPQINRTASEPVVVGELNLSEDVTFPERILELMMEADPKFKLTWAGRRTDFLDQSPSVYDLSIANTGVQAGLTDQEIASLIIGRRKWVGADLKLRQDYYQRTISKARNG